MSKISDAISIIQSAKGESKKALLFCSYGKDSLVLLDLLSKEYEEVVSVFMYFVKGLEHIDKFGRWIKVKYPNVTIDEVPHWNLTRIKRVGMYCVSDPKIKLLKLKDIEVAMCLRYGIEKVYYGMKKADSLNRNLMLKKSDGIIHNAVYPLMDWTQKDILSYMRMHKLPEPIRYSKNASGGCGFNLECFLFLRDNYPQDLERIYEVFPLSKRILFEHDYKQENHGK